MCICVWSWNAELSNRIRLSRHIIVSFKLANLNGLSTLSLNAMDVHNRIEFAE